MKHFTILFTFLLTLGSAWTFAQATYETTGGHTNWDNTSTWTLAAGSPADSDADGLPDADDDVNILPGHTVLVNTNGACDDLTITDDASFTEFQVLVNDTLDVGGNWVVTTSDAFAEIIISVKGVMNIGGILNVNTSFEETAIEFEVDYDAVLNINGLATSRFWIVTNSTGCIFNNNGTINSAGPFRIRAYDGTSLSVTNNGQWNAAKDLTLRIQDSGSRMTFSNKATLDCNDGLNLRSGFGALPAHLLFDMGYTNSTLNIYNDINMQTDGGTIYASNSLVSTVTWDGVNPQTIITDSKVKYHHLVVNNTGGLVAPDGDLTATNFYGDLTIGSGATLSDAAQNVSILGDFNNNGGSYTQSTDLTIAGSYSALSGSSHSAEGDIDIAGSFTNAGTFTSTGAGCDLDVVGNWSNTGTYTYVVGDTVTMSGITGSNTLEGTTTFYNLIINHAGTSVDVDGGTVSIANVLDIDNGTLNTSDAVVLLSSASGTGQLADITGGNISGNITVQRYLDVSTAGWFEIASPVNGTTLGDWSNDGVIMTGFANSDYPEFPSAASPFVSVWDYDENQADGTKDDGWNEASDIEDATAPTSGHRVYIGAGQYTLSVSGKPYKNSQSFSLKYQNITAAEMAASAEEKGWNLVGNPYPCTIDWDHIATGDKVNLDDLIYIYSAEAGNFGIYYGGDGPDNGTNGVDNRIAHSQSFWVHATADNPSLNINEDDKIIFDKPFVKSGDAVPPLKIRISGDVNSYYDEALVRINDQATDGYDSGLDASKFETYKHLRAVSPALSLVADDHYLSVNTISSQGDHHIPIKVKVGSQAHGNYTLDFDNLESFLPNACMVLEDLQTGEFTDLRFIDSYTFQSTVAVSGPRFILHIIYNKATVSDCLKDLEQSTSTITLTTAEVPHFIHQDGSMVYLNTRFNAPTVAKISVVNALGQEVFQLPATTVDYNKIELPLDASNGIYFIRIQTATNQTVLKYQR